jgi:hypothetical protein
MHKTRVLQPKYGEIHPLLRNVLRDVLWSPLAGKNAQVRDNRNTGHASAGRTSYDNRPCCSGWTDFRNHLQMNLIERLTIWSVDFDAPRYLLLLALATVLVCWAALHPIAEHVAP